MQRGRKHAAISVKLPYIHFLAHPIRRRGKTSAYQTLHAMRYQVTRLQFDEVLRLVGVLRWGCGVLDTGMLLPEDLGHVGRTSSIPRQNLSKFSIEDSKWRGVRTFWVFLGTSVSAPDVPMEIKLFFSCFGVISATAKPDSAGGCRDKKYARRPAIWGDAMDVPEIFFVAYSLPIQAD